MTSGTSLAGIATFEPTTHAACDRPQPRSLRRPATHRSFQLPILKVKPTEGQPEILVCLIAVRGPIETSVTHGQCSAEIACLHTPVDTQRGSH